MKAQESIGRWISLIHRQGQIYISKELRDLKIGSAQLPFLTVLYHEDGLSQEEISRILNVDKATAARDIRKLHDKGFVNRKRNPEDNRAYQIFITEKGRKIMPDVMKVLQRWTSILSSDFTKKETQMVIKLLMRMHKNALSTKHSNH